jgi:hypothetical protein
MPLLTLLGVIVLVTLSRGFADSAGGQTNSRNNDHRAQTGSGGAGGKAVGGDGGTAIVINGKPAPGSTTVGVADASGGSAIGGDGGNGSAGGNAVGGNGGNAVGGNGDNLSPGGNAVGGNGGNGSAGGNAVGGSRATATPGAPGASGTPGSRPDGGAGGTASGGNCSAQVVLIQGGEQPPSSTFTLTVQAARRYAIQGLERALPHGRPSGLTCNRGRRNRFACRLKWSLKQVSGLDEQRCFYVKRRSLFAGFRTPVAGRRD